MRKKSPPPEIITVPIIMKLWYLLLLLEFCVMTMYLVRRFPEYAFSISYSDINARSTPLSRAVSMILIPLYLASAGIYLYIIYRSFKTIGEKYSITRPRRLILYYFIPLFNILWAFYVIIRLPSRINSCIEKNKLSAPRINIPFTWVAAAVMLLSKLSIYYDFPESHAGEALTLITSITVSLIFMNRISNSIGYLELNPVKIK